MIPEAIFRLKALQQGLLAASKTEIHDTFQSALITVLKIREFACCDMSYEIFIKIIAD